MIRFTAKKYEDMIRVTRRLTGHPYWFNQDTMRFVLTHR